MEYCAVLLRKVTMWSNLVKPPMIILGTFCRIKIVALHEAITPNIAFRAFLLLFRLMKGTTQTKNNRANSSPGR